MQNVPHHSLSVNANFNTPPPGGAYLFEDFEGMLRREGVYYNS